MTTVNGKPIVFVGGDIKSRYFAEMQARGMYEEIFQDADEFVKADDEKPSREGPRTFSAGTYVRQGRRIGRNEPCPCGSGAKFKKCCIDKR